MWVNCSFNHIHCDVSVRTLKREVTRMAQAPVVSMSQPNCGLFLAHLAVCMSIPSNLVD